MGPWLRRAAFCAALGNAAGLVLPSIGEKAVTHATNSASVQKWLDEHCSATCVLGFDTETRPTFKADQPQNPPSVVQLSTEDACLVAPIFVAPSQKGKAGKRVMSPREARNAADGVRRTLAATLESRFILKAGVGIDQDAIDLWQHWGLEVNGRLELGRSTDASGARSRPRSLKHLLADATGIELAKSKKVQMSDWAAAPLSERQVAYAAADAWAGKAVYERLAELDAQTFGYEPVRRVLSSEPCCARLYAYQRARQGMRSAERELEFGLPFYREDAGGGQVLGKRAKKKLAELRGAFSREVVDPTLVVLPVYRALDNSQKLWLLKGASN
jgi:hypothetical protein